MAGSCPCGSSPLGVAMASGSHLARRGSHKGACGQQMPAAHARRACRNGLPLPVSRSHIGFRLSRWFQGSSALQKRSPAWDSREDPIPVGLLPSLGPGTTVGEGPHTSTDPHPQVSPSESLVSTAGARMAGSGSDWGAQACGARAPMLLGLCSTPAPPSAPPSPAGQSSVPPQPCPEHG